MHWVASSPFDLHQAEGGFFLLAPPQLLGDTATGVVVEAGEEEDSLKIGDEVRISCFRFLWNIVNIGWSRYSVR